MSEKRKLSTYSKRHSRRIISKETENDLVMCSIDNDDSDLVQCEEKLNEPSNFSSASCSYEQDYASLPEVNYHQQQEYFIDLDSERDGNRHERFCPYS